MTTYDWILLALPVAAGILAILATKLGAWMSPSRQGKEDANAAIVQETANQIGKGVVAVIRHDREKNAEQMKIMAKSLLHLRNEISELIQRTVTRHRERA